MDIAATPVLPPAEMLGSKAMPVVPNTVL